MSQPHRNPNHLDNPTDPLFELLEDGQAITSSATFRDALRSRLMDLPPIAGLITFRLPIVGRVFLPRLVATFGLVAIGVGLATVFLLRPDQPAEVPEPAAAIDSMRADVESDRIVVAPIAEVLSENAEDAEAALARGEALQSFDPPRAPVRLPADDAAATVVDPATGPVPAAPAADPIAARPTLASTETPAQAPSPPETGGRSRPAAPNTPVPTPTEAAAQAGAGDIALPPTATPWPTSEGRPTLPPAFPTAPPTWTPEPTPPTAP